MKKELDKVLNYIVKYQNLLFKKIADNQPIDSVELIKYHNKFKDLYKSFDKIYNGLEEIGLIDQCKDLLLKPYRKTYENRLKDFEIIK